MRRDLRKNIKTINTAMTFFKNIKKLCGDFFFVFFLTVKAPPKLGYLLTIL